MHEGSIEDILIGITKPSIDRLLKMQNPGDCIALYALYCYIRKWQNNCNIFATSEYAMKALDWGRDKFSKAKNQLVDAGFVQDVQNRDEDNKIDGWYIKVRYAMSSTLGKFHTTEIPQGGKSADKYPLMVNEIPFNGKQIQERKNLKLESRGINSEFDSFYATYPKKVAKHNAKKAWMKNKCSLEQVLPALEAHKKNWKDPQFIPHPATWLNQRRWEDDITVNNTQANPTRMLPADLIKHNNWTDEFWTWLHVDQDRADIERDYLGSIEERWLIDFIKHKNEQGYF